MPPLNRRASLKPLRGEGEPDVIEAATATAIMMTM
jgi:hypothetical protein